jgi:hypothetical protein
VQEVNIPLAIRGIGKGNDATSNKEGEVDGLLIEFAGDPAAAFLSWASFKRMIQYKGAMQAGTNGSAPRKGAADA